MGLNGDPEWVPLRTDTDDVIRIGQTRVTLDTLIDAFQQGETPETMVSQYPSLRLDEVYTVIGYYLRHRPQIEEYLRQRRQQAEQVRQENEARFDPVGIRDRLLARHPQQGESS
jgi:uncharacterized protein (DUF433 family)